MMEKKETRESLVLENEGQKIFSVLHRPINDNPPIVIVMHGFASNKIGTGRYYVKLAEELCKVGIACLRFDFRGSGDSEGSLSEMTLESFVSDALKILSYVESQSFSSIGFFGSSLGGTISILTAARHKAIQALVLWAPVASGEMWFKDYLAQSPLLPNPDPNVILRAYRGVALNQEMRKQFEKMVAYKTIEELDMIPLLHFQGDKDETISLHHQRAFQEHREKAQGDSKFITYSDTGHSLGFATVLPEVIQEAVHWFKKYL